MTLAIDVGNGSVKYARFEGERVLESGRLALDADFAPLRRDEEAAAVSVNPPALARLRAAVPGLRVAGEDFAAPIPVRYEPPGACGLDRVLGCVGALALEPDAPAILLLDAGTCLSMTAADRAEGVLGGAILPGPELWSRALAAFTAQLPRVAPLPPARAIGRSTEESIRAGIGFGFDGAVRELLRRALAERPGARVVATGTGGAALKERLPEVDVHQPFAVLRGVYLASRR